MKSTFQDQVVGIPVNSEKFAVRRSPMRYLPGPDSQYPPALKQTKKDSILERMNKLGKKADSFANGVREHVRLGSKITETVKGKLSLGAKILQEGGVEKTFKQLFAVSEDEKLLKASQSYLSTTAGPIAGLLFISNQKTCLS
ncbi:GEM-LIKE PROTEIN 2 [Salix purpurea]|uniref:GEM-LIKE PROTEIN 2 n=1 Tax=Salix purpurea TaxID=77065 RepID=A0A9Q0WWP7_SALPP|nr:GEM-LIKE PROTEIN 2 [Salix purpurea]